MDLFDSKRQERLEAARKAATASKEASLKFLIDAGILEYEIGYYYCYI